MHNNELVLCQILKRQVRRLDAMPAALIRPGIFQLIKRRHPDFSHEGYISKEALKEFRGEYIENVLVEEGRELSDLDKEVIQSMVEHETVAQNLNKEFEHEVTFGERLSDRIAMFGGSWTFIIIFVSVLIVWIILNATMLLFRAFDPFPFILLNLVLSCIAALQAPVIMMSQNRREAKDRLRSEHDYKINLKAELEIRHLHEKIDHLIQHQWQRLLEIQELQLDTMESWGQRGGMRRMKEQPPPQETPTQQPGPKGDGQAKG
jgi:uncharacterized membrane protein